MSALIEQRVEVPAHLAQYVNTETNAAALAEISKIAGGGFPRLGRNNNPAQFKLIEDGETKIFGTPQAPVSSLPIVIVDFTVGHRAYYAKKYDSKAEPESPDCLSSSGISPDASVSKPEALNCATCKWNAFGTNDRNGKRCAESIMCAIVFPQEGWKNKLLQFRLTASEITGFKKFIQELTTNGYPLPYSVINVALDTSEGHVKYQLSFAGFVDESVAASITELRNTKAADEMLGRKNAPMDAETYARLTGTHATDPQPAQAPPPAQAPMAPTPTAPMAAPTAPMAAPTAPMAAPTAPMAAPTAPTAPMAAPTPAPLPVPTMPTAAPTPAPTAAQPPTPVFHGGAAPQAAPAISADQLLASLEGLN